jgi:phosphoglycolate phosphatase
MDSMPAVLFDLDGTLVDSLADIGSAVDAVLARLGHPSHSLDAYRSFVGEGARELVRRALPPGHTAEQLEHALALYRAQYRAHVVEQTRPYDGIEALLAQMRSRGVPLAVVTNKPHEVALEVVDRCFARGTFEAVLGQRDGEPHKPDPAGALSILRALGVTPSEALFVGDSDVDMKTAKNAGIRAVGVTWGFRDRGVLEAHGADHLVEHPREIAMLLRGRTPIG